MPIFDRLRRAAREFVRPHVAATLTEHGDLDALLRALRSEVQSQSGANVNVTSAERIAAVFTCVRILSSTISHLPLKLMRTNGDRRDPALDDPLYFLLHDQPNDWQTSLEFRELLQRDLELRGNGYALIVRGGGNRVIELLRMHPDQVQPKQDKQTLRLTYEFRSESGRTQTLDQGDVFHLRGLSDDGIKGKNPIAVHRETLGDAIAMQTHGSRFFSNGAKPLGLLEWDIPSDGKLMPELGKTARDELKRDFESSYAGSENAFKTLILPPLLKYKPVSISQRDARYIESRKFTRSEIFGIYGVPPHKGGDLERATFSNIEHQSLEFVIDAIVPRVVRWEMAIKRDVLRGDRNLDAKFIVAGLLRGDFRSRQQGLMIQRRNGVINANEWRAKEDMNPRDDEGGEQYIVESNMTTDPDAADAAA